MSVQKITPESTPRSHTSTPHLSAVHTVYDLCIVGLEPDSIRLAARGAVASMSVACSDTRAKSIERFNRADVGPDAELVDIIEDGLADQTVRAFSGAARASAFVISALPVLQSDGYVDSTPVEDAIDAVVDVVEYGNLIVLDAPTAPGTTRGLLAEKLEAVGMLPGEDVFVATVWVSNGRCFVGGVTPRCTERAAELYGSLFEFPIQTATADACELARLAHRTHEEMNAAFANELSAVSKHLGLDTWSVLSLARSGGSTTLAAPSPGPADLNARFEPRLFAAACEHDTALTRAAISQGELQPARIAGEVRSAARRFVSPTIACLGLGSGPDGALPHSPALRVASLLSRGQLGQLLVVDPRLSVSPVPGAPLVSLTEALKQADIVVVLSDEPSFAAAPRELYSRASVIDTLGLLTEQPS
ncbi:MAG: hypothetical protein KUG77_20235 [Nannocystaceae bacterium]|nr:hypothetical protein [Nannocystaceae bacterium]